MCYNKIKKPEAIDSDSDVDIMSLALAFGEKILSIIILWTNKGKQNQSNKQGSSPYIKHVFHSTKWTVLYRFEVK